MGRASNAKQGKRADLDNIYFRSAWEANVARYLNFLIQQKQIRGWDYEPDVFEFPGVKGRNYAYRPDFRIMENDRSIVYYEVKGWMDNDSRIRLKRMAKVYPNIKIVLIDAAAYQAIASQFSHLPHWEGGSFQRKRALPSATKPKRKKGTY